MTTIVTRAGKGVALTHTEVDANFTNLNTDKIERDGSVAFTGKQTFATPAAGFASANFPHGIAPTSPANGDFWTATTGLFARINGVTQQAAFLSGGSFTGLISTVAAAAGGAGFRLPHGAAPTTPTNGDVWTTTAGLFARVNGVTQQYVPTTGTAALATDLAGGAAGQILYQNAANDTAFTVTGTSGQVLRSNGTAAPTWVELDLTYMPTASFKKSVMVATTANITLSGTQTIDGVALVGGERVLVKDQTTTSQNGIYVVAAGAWTRATDADSASELAGAVVNVDRGTAQGGQLWTTTFRDTDTVGTTALSWFRVVDTGMAGAAAPAMNGTAAVGTSVLYARQDHVHPTDTSRAPLASPTFTGTVTVPGLRVGVTTRTAAYTAAATDHLILCNATTAAFAVTLPTAVGVAGLMFVVKKIDSSANAVTVNTTSSQTIDGALTRVLSTQWSAVRLISDGANWMVAS